MYHPNRISVCKTILGLMRSCNLLHFNTYDFRYFNLNKVQFSGRHTTLPGKHLAVPLVGCQLAEHSFYDLSQNIGHGEKVVS